MNKKNIEKFVKGTSQILIESFTKDSILRIPYYRNNINVKKIRISEQELRLAAIHYLFSKCIKHSIETPTDCKYSFSSKNIEESNSIKEPKDKEYNGQSAQTDLSIHDDNNDIILRVEFKAHQPTLPALHKDILKLKAEGSPGLFFHVLQNTDIGTVDALINKFKEDTPDSIKVKNKPKLKNKYYIAILCLNYKKEKLNDPCIFFFESSELESYSKFKQTFINIGFK